MVLSTYMCKLGGKNAVVLPVNTETCSHRVTVVRVSVNLAAEGINK
jgi:hypothetical protein